MALHAWMLMSNDFLDVVGLAVQSLRETWHEK